MCLLFEVTYIPYELPSPTDSFPEFRTPQDLISNCCINALLHRTRAQTGTITMSEKEIIHKDISHVEANGNFDRSWREED